MIKLESILSDLISYTYYSQYCITAARTLISADQFKIQVGLYQLGQ